MGYSFVVIRGDAVPLGSWRTEPSPLVGGRQAHRLAILGYRAARDRDALGRQQLGDAAVAQRVGRRFLADQLPDLGGGGGRGGAAAAAGALDPGGEEIAH